jgi:hypothetical protein
MSDWHEKLCVETINAFRTPTLKQKEAYGRLSHTFSAASLIGSVTLIFAETPLNALLVFKLSALMFWGVLLFWVGALLSKGE